MRICRSPGCMNETATLYGVFCRAHRARFRRHGSADQQAVTKADLTPYMKIVAARREKNAGSPLWSQLSGRWATVLDHARGITEAYHAGRPSSAHEVKAAHEVAKVAAEGLSQEAIDTALAMFVMRGLEPRRFRSDKAFTTQLVRRVRSIGDMNVGSTWDHQAGKERRVYRDTAPRVAEIMGGWIAEALGAAGLRLAELEEQDLNARQEETNAMYQAMGELK